jgi:hypothetical protein
MRYVPDGSDVDSSLAGDDLRRKRRDGLHVKALKRLREQVLLRLHCFLLFLDDAFLSLIYKFEISFCLGGGRGRHRLVIFHFYHFRRV